LSSVKQAFALPDLPCLPCTSESSGSQERTSWFGRPHLSVFIVSNLFVDLALSSHTHELLAEAHLEAGIDMLDPDDEQLQLHNDLFFGRPDTDHSSQDEDSDLEIDDSNLLIDSVDSGTASAIHWFSPSSCFLDCAYPYLQPELKPS
jgi:hypothetical protein